MVCPNCGGSMIGDGYTTVLHCENANENDYHDVTPDDDPIYCKKLITYQIVLEQYLGNEWIKIISVNMPKEICKEDVIDIIDTTTDGLLKNTVIRMTEKDETVIVRGENGPIRLTLLTKKS